MHLETTEGAQPLLSLATLRKCTGDSGFWQNPEPDSVEPSWWSEPASIRPLPEGEWLYLLDTWAKLFPEGLPDPRKGSDPGRKGEVVYTQRAFYALKARAYRAGARQGPHGGALHWSLSGQSKYPCQRPVLVAWIRGVSGHVAARGRTIGFVAKWGRCRECETCKKQVRMAWIARMNLEGRAAAEQGGRIWFVTLTSNETHRARVERAAMALAQADGADFHRLSSDEQFSFRSQAFVPFVSQWLKRLRTPFLVECKEALWDECPVRVDARGRELNSRHHPVTGRTLRRKAVAESIKSQCRENGRHAPDFTYTQKISPCFKFVAVTEAHSGVDPETGFVNEWLRGRAHAHLLVYEADRLHALHEHRFREAWSLHGFAQAKLVEDEARVARYLSKYLTKDERGRIWASEFFGRSSSKGAAPSAP